MAVTKRIRFEVLRRDNYTCRYCRSTDNPLHVDHVTPVSLGGTDDPSNLVASCKDCNVGKASSSPDASLVAEVKDESLRHAELVRGAYAVLVERMGERDDYVDEFADAWTSRDNVPAAWRESVGRWFEMGVPIELVVDAARKACAIDRNFGSTDRFRYMCAIVWNQVQVVSAAAEQAAYLDGKWMSEEDLVDERVEAYEHGQRAEQKRWEPAYPDYIARALLTMVVDGPRTTSTKQKIGWRDPLRDLREAVGAHGS